MLLNVARRSQMRNIGASGLHLAFSIHSSPHQYIDTTPRKVRPRFRKILKNFSGPWHVRTYGEKKHFPHRGEPEETA